MRNTTRLRLGDSAPGVDIRLLLTPDAPAAARRALAESHLPAELLEVGQLVVSELVTNSVRHSRGDPGQWIGLKVRAGQGGVRLEVCDPGPGFRLPPPFPRSADGFGGRGLPIVDRLASRWGARRTPEGRWEVWAELDRRTAGR